ncbi:MAG: inorganic phosphate transporter [Bacteroidetes bacterium]|nr:inorganic phosphate transporter [Bacteroidota bacterium]
MLHLILFIIVVALIFDFLNGFHDSANSIATVVSTRVLSPRQAVAWAAFFNLTAAFVFDVHVAKTVGRGLVHIELIDEWVILAGLLGAIMWNIITWYYGIPSSSSHALIGGYAGAAVAKAGFDSIIYSGWTDTLIFIAVAPLMGMIMAFIIMVTMMWIFRKRSSSKVNHWFRKLQLLSAAAYSLGHGTNDAQKTMGIITSLLVTATATNAAELPEFLRVETFHVPVWVIFTSHIAIAIGTLFGGWRIVKTMGQKITKLKPSGGFAAETAGALTLLVTAFSGIAVSTTHVISGAIMGVGATKRASAVRWGLAGNIIIAWILTIPASAVIGAVCYWIVRLFQ